MKSFGLTGGIATGKSTASQLFRSIDPSIVLFDADACVGELYGNPDILAELEAIFGHQTITYTESGLLRLNRDYVRDVIFSDQLLKKKLQDLIHPLVRKECLAMQREALHSDHASMFIADVPLLFEGGFDFGQSANLVVALSRETQIRRLKIRSGFNDDTILAILAAQLPISHKVKYAHVVLWNEGPKSVLEAQIKKFIKENNHE